MNAIQLELSNERRFGLARAMIVYYEGFLGLSHLAPIDERLASARSSPQTSSNYTTIADTDIRASEESTSLRVATVTLLADVALICHRSSGIHIDNLAEYFMPRVTSIFVSPSPLITVLGFEGTVFPPWQAKDRYLDPTSFQDRNDPSDPGIYTKLKSANSLAAVFAMVQCMSAYRRAMDQRIWKDALTTFSPLSQAACALQMTSRKKKKKQDMIKMSEILDECLAITKGNLSEHAARCTDSSPVWQTFPAMLQGAASCSWSICKLPFCNRCQLPVARDEPIGGKNRIVKQNALHIPREAYIPVQRELIPPKSIKIDHVGINLGTAITEFFSPSERPSIDQSAQPPVLKISHVRAMVEQPLTSYDHGNPTCQQCGHGTEGGERVVLMDRLPYYLTFIFDHSHMLWAMAPNRIIETLPSDWDSYLTVDNAMLLTGATPKSTYELIGAIYHGEGEASYVTLWREPMDGEPWRAFESSSKTRTRKQTWTGVSSEEVCTRLGKSYRTIMTLLIYRQVSPEELEAMTEQKAWEQQQQEEGQ